MKSKQNTGGLVYSTEHGKFCPKCKKPVGRCICKQQQKNKISPNDGIIRIGRETKGRKGKGVSLIHGVPLQGKELQAFAKELKKKCGSGGTLKDGVIEIQGDHRERLLEILSKKDGWIVKLAGG
ncbi:MAG: translation initiation factor Sui1 [Mariprofundaceae bacterium]|nr:translation initiation factor Sui1 [Mariprofundaceae bacterium]